MSLGTLADILLDRCRCRHQPRTTVGQDYIDGLAKNIEAVGQKVPIIAHQDGEWYEIDDGNCRVAAKRLLGHQTVTAVVHPNAPTLTEMQLTQAAIDCQRNNLGPCDRANLWHSIMTGSGWTGKALAETLGLSPATVSRTLGLRVLAPDLQAKVNAGEFDFSKAVLIAQKTAEHDEQRALARVAKDICRDDLAAKLRPSATKAPAARAARALLTLPNRLVVSVTAKEVTISSVIDALSAALEATKKAQRDGVETVATLSRILKERSKKVTKEESDAE
jgi:ParB/RepB/Spo0J family partition protein